MLIAEDLLLLLLDDESGKTTAAYVDVALGGGILIELALRGDVEVHGERGVFARQKVRVSGSSRADDPVLDAALMLVAEKERTAQDLVGRLGKGSRDTLLPRLAERGILRLQEGRILGLFPTRRWPAADSTHEDDVRRQLADVLVRGLSADERISALVALLHATGQAHKVIDREGVSSGDVKRRAKEIAEGEWPATAVRDAIQASIAATNTAVMVATTAAVTSS